MSEEHPRPSLNWSKQFHVLPTAATPSLRGDKIILPPSVLEQLLSAATTTVPTSARPQTSTFDPFNPYSYAAETEARQNLFDREQNLPHPLTFRLVNPENSKIVFAGVREFSAPDETVGLSPFLSKTLGVGDVEDGLAAEDPGHLPRLTIHLQELPKGTYIKLRPLEAGYDPDDWKALLEQYLRDTFTTLTNQEIINVAAGRETFRFLVDGLKPNEEAISIIDTDIEVDIEPLNEEQARETLQKLAQKSQRAPGTKDGSSRGGKLLIDSTETGQVLPEEYVDYSIEDWDSSLDLDIEVNTLTDAPNIDIFVSPYGPRYRSNPREDEFVFGDLSSSTRKRLKISHTNVELEGASAIRLSIRYYVPELSEQHLPSIPAGYSIRASYLKDASIPTEQRDAEDYSLLSPEEDRCSNCQQPVPKSTMFLHQNFCLRNNVLCPHCRNIFQKRSEEWKNHWHCQHDSEYGDTPASKQKHDRYSHTLASCPSCDFAASSMPALAHHRTTTCPAKLILCQFCHLQVSQQGPDDPSFDSAEVLLSGLSPHEVSDGARTTECHLCSRIVRLRDMSAHLRHHDIQRLDRIKPKLCRNFNCGRTIDLVSKTGDVRPQAAKNDLGICETCFGPLYVSMYDPDGRALKRRVERKYLTQLLTGCGQTWCRNKFCKSGRKHMEIGIPEQGLTSKEAMQMTKPILDRLTDLAILLHFCTDESSQKRKTLAEMMAAEGAHHSGKGKGKAVESTNGVTSANGYELEWCVAALEIEGGDLDRARSWLKGFAPTRAESAAQ